MEHTLIKFQFEQMMETLNRIADALEHKSAVDSDFDNSKHLEDCPLCEQDTRV